MQVKEVIMKTLSVKQTAKILEKPEQFIRLGLQQNKFPFGAAVKNEKEFSYVIYKKKLEEFVGEIENENG